MQLPATTTLPSRAARLIVLAILIGIGISHVVFAIRDWPLHDMDVYLAAAARLRDGQPLYSSSDSAVNAFWYAPWFAVLWIPFTYLSREVVAVGWSAILLAGTGVTVLLLAQRGRWGAVLAVLVGPPLFAVSAGGNIQPLMVLALLLGFHRPWGPLAVAVAASMKVTPVLLVAAYLARREWLKAIASLVFAGILLFPGYLMGMARAGNWDAAPALFGISPVLYGGVVIAALAAVYIIPGRFAILAAAAAAVLALPRLFVYDVTLLTVGAATAPEPREVS